MKLNGEVALCASCTAGQRCVDSQAPSTAYSVSCPIIRPSTVQRSLVAASWFAHH